MSDGFIFEDLRFPTDGSVLNGIMLSVGADESVALFGPNGGGKSSVMRLIAGTAAGSSPLAEVSYLPQTPYLFRGSVGSNLVLGLNADEADEAGRLAIELKVGDLLLNHSNKVSVGEAQRISLARTLALRTPLVLLDEPLAPINAAGRGEVAEIIRHRTATRALLWATHSIEAVHAIADRLVVIDGGIVLQEGPVNEVLDSPIDERVADILGDS
jgi:ABC-type transport system involved in cytochrome bd biosynthesis fused ATPase/permease subunit